MKATAKMGEFLEGNDPTDDVGILTRLSAVHGALHGLASERGGIVQFLPERRKHIEQIAARVAARHKASAHAGTEVTADVEWIPPQLDAEAPVPPQPAGEGTLLVLETPTKADIETPGDTGASLEERARRLASGLSPSALRIYHSLLKAEKWPFTIVPNGDSCSGCNMRLPSAFLGEISRVTALHRCPYCKRVLAAAVTTAPS